MIIMALLKIERYIFPHQYLSFCGTSCIRLIYIYIIYIIYLYLFL